MVERAAGIIVFRDTAEGRRYLLLRSSRPESEIAAGKHMREFWDLPKGRLEAGETGLTAALREAREEAGITEPRVIEGFKETIRYFTRREGKSVLKFVAFFLAEASSGEVILSHEHDQFAWLPHEGALARVSLAPMRAALRKAQKFLPPFSPG